jgi:MFS family permease
LAIFGRIELWNLLLLYFIFGAILAIDNPARRAFLVDLVSEDQLANAVSLNATLFNLASVIGFALAGVLIATIGVGQTMLINALTYAFPILALLAMRLTDISQDKERGKIGIAMTEGFTTLFKQPSVLIVITIMAVVGGLAYPALFGLMPAFAKDVMNTDSVGLGILYAMAALGSVIGTVVTARLGIHNRGRNLIFAALLLPLTVITFAWSPVFWVACVLLVGMGIMLLVVQSLAVTLVQLNIADRVRGRVMSIYSILHAGADTGSNLVVGTLAVPLGLPLALSIGGGVALAYALIVLLFFASVRQLD